MCSLCEASLGEEEDEHRKLRATSSLKAGEMTGRIAAFARFKGDGGARVSGWVGVARW